MAQSQIIAAVEAFRGRQEVATVADWNNGQRYYINLARASRRAKGDATTKIWIDGQTGIIAFEMHKGTCSSEFLADCESLKNFARTMGTPAYDHPGIWDLKIKITA